VIFFFSGETVATKFFVGDKLLLRQDTLLFGEAFKSFLTGDIEEKLLFPEAHEVLQNKIRK
jgi:hypothetical protein